MTPKLRASILPGWYRDLAPNGRRAFLSGYAGFSLDAMSVQLYAFVLPVLLLSWGLSPSRAGLLVTATLIASSLGGWVAGLISDRVGRIKVLIVTVVWLAGSSLLCGLSQTYNQLLFARALQGLGFGAEWAVGAVFLGEIASPATRGRLVGTAQSAWAAGWGLAATVSTAAIALLPASIGWRASFLAVLPPALIILQLRRGLRTPQSSPREGRVPPWHGIFTQAMRQNTLKGCLLAAGTHGGYWAIATWWPAVLRSEHGLTAAQAAGHTAALVASSFIGYLLAAWFADAIGRKKTIQVFGLAAMASILIATLLPLSPTMLLLITLPLGIGVMGLYSAIGPALIELYPAHLRGSGLGFCYNVGRGIAGAVPPAVGGAMATYGLGRSVGLYMCLAYGILLIVSGFLRETRGLDLA